MMRTLSTQTSHKMIASKMDIDTTSQSPSQNLITDDLLLSTLSTLTAAREAALHVLSLTLSTPPRETFPSDTSHLLALSRAQKPLLTHLAHLRSHNRRLAHLSRATKQQTSTSRAEVDTLHLSLQNLHYESRHLAGEIAACEGFRHTYVELPLESEEEFLAREENEGWRRWREGLPVAEEEEETANGASEETQTTTLQATAQDNSTDHPMNDISSADPPSTTLPATQEQDWSDQALMHARIAAELAERQRLEDVRKTLVARKMELVRENAKRKEELGKLDGELEAFIDAAKPIQRTFEKEW